MTFRNKSILKKGFKKVHDENFGVTDYYNEAVVEEIEGRESMNDTRTPTSFSSGASSDNPRYEILDISHIIWLNLSLKNEPMQAEDVADDEDTATDEGRILKRAKPFTMTVNLLISGRLSMIEFRSWWNLRCHIFWMLVPDANVKTVSK